jgi:hypothetical protein
MQFIQVRRFPLTQLQTAVEGFGGEIFDLCNVDGDSSLKISHGNFRSCHSERSEESQIVFAGQSKTMIKDVSVRSK